MDAVQLEPRFREPLLQIRDRRGIVVVEVRPRCEHFDRLEAVRRDLEELIAPEPLSVIQVRGHPELTLGGHRTDDRL